MEWSGGQKSILKAAGCIDQSCFSLPIMMLVRGDCLSLPSELIPRGTNSSSVSMPFISKPTNPKPQS